MNFHRTLIRTSEVARHGGAMVQSAAMCDICFGTTWHPSSPRGSYLELFFSVSTRNSRVFKLHFFRRVTHVHLLRSLRSNTRLLRHLCVFAAEWHQFVAWQHSASIRHSKFPENAPNLQKLRANKSSKSDPMHGSPDSAGRLWDLQSSLTCHVSGQRPVNKSPPQSGSKYNHS